MDLSIQTENQNFLLICGPPYKGVCKLMTLKSAVIILGTFDVAIGVIGFIRFIMDIIFLSRNTRNLYLIPHIFISAIRALCIFFALIGIRGMTRMNLNDISLYKKFKIFEFFSILFLTIAYLIIYFILFPRRITGVWTFVLIIVRILSVPLTKIV